MLNVSFFTALSQNLFAVRPHPVIEDLGQGDIDRICAKPVKPDSIEIRHTVGLVDPLTSGDLALSERVDDGLPETLEEVVAFYGNRYFKLKVSGNAEADMKRLEKIARVLDTIDHPYFVTLDGNEQFPDAKSFADFFRAVQGNRALRRLADSILYVEQPINRNTALEEPITALAGIVPVIIDESDGALSSFPQARELGYSGVSSKVCKGVYKSLINHARSIAWSGQGNPEKYFMSAEDLTCEPGIALHQDLSLVCALGLGHVEKNAHHFIDGFERRPESEKAAFLKAHPDMYHREDGQVRLRIKDGVLRIGTLERSGFGTDQIPMTDVMEPSPPADWRE